MSYTHIRVSKDTNEHMAKIALPSESRDALIRRLLGLKPTGRVPRGSYPRKKKS